MTKQEAIFNYLLRLGDNALITGHRLAEWCSKAPLLEEDLALTNMALDHIGRAQALLKYAGEVEGIGKTEDDLAYKRDERHFYNNLITELPNTDFAFTIVRQLLVATFELELYKKLTDSKDEIIAGIASKALKEVRYHYAHAYDWCCRLGNGTTLSHYKMQQALDALWMYTDELFEMTEIDTVLLKKNIAVDLSELKPLWNNEVTVALAEASLIIPADTYMQSGSRAGIHTEHLGHVLAEMQYLQRAYPTAQW